MKYPERGKKIDEFDKNSPYLVRVYKPDSLETAFFDYSNNYYLAGNKIAKYLLRDGNTDISELDTYLFSIAFLYRHSLELGLKSIAFKYIQDKNERIIFVNDTFHNLEQILGAIDKYINLLIEEKEYSWLKTYLKDISKIDMESDSFRYPFHIYWDCFGNINVSRVFDKQTHINLEKFANKFQIAYQIIRNLYLENKVSVNECENLQPCFIEEGGHYYAQSVVGYSYCREDFYPYRKAYLDTANYLKSQMKACTDLGNIEEAEKLFLPMCYLYRNCTELSLKTIWFEEVGEEYHVRCKYMMNKKHSITGMWNLISNYVTDYCNTEEEKEFINVLGEYCKELQRIDSDASKFRYPVQKKMQPYFSENKRFDFLSIGDFFEAMNIALDSIKSEMSNQNDYIAEAEAEYNNEMQAEMSSYYYE